MKFKEITNNHIIAYDIIKLSLGNNDHNNILNVLDKYKNDDKKLIGCFLDNKLIGIIGIQNKSRKTIITHISVEEKYQRKSIGKKLIEYVIEKYQSPLIQLETDNESVGFYIKLGFKCSSTKNKFCTLRYKCSLKIKKF